MIGTEWGKTSLHSSGKDPFRSLFIRDHYRILRKNSHIEISQTFSKKLEKLRSVIFLSSKDFLKPKTPLSRQMEISVYFKSLFRQKTEWNQFFSDCFFQMIFCDN